MDRHRTVRVMTAGLSVALLGGLAAAIGQAATAAPRDQALVRQGDFAAAAREFHVPERVLLAVSYAESRWDDHAGRPSTTGAYGPMALVWRPGGASSPRGLATSGTGVQTLSRAAKLIGAAPAKLRTDPAANIRGGAALLAYQEKRLTGGTPAAAGKWYPAVAAYSGSATGEALTFADDVYAALRSGASRTTVDGQRLSLKPGAVTPDRSAAKRLRLAATTSAAKAECPASLHCVFEPAAYKQTDPSDPTAYGNYDTAKRPKDLKIDYIVIHDTEEGYDQTRQEFTDPTAAVSAHYVVRSSDGQITQMVRTKDVAWQAGNWDINSHSIGIEHEGYEATGATWYTEPMYRHSARLVRYLAKRFGIPVDRGHIIGHENVPATSAAGTAGMHTDPGPYWDWDHYLDLVRGTADRTAWSGTAKQVRIAPDFATNKPPLTTCDANGTCTKEPAQGASMVPLRSAPRDDAPLLGDPSLHPGGKPGTTVISDWGDQASSGQKFAVAGRRPGWVGIWYAGTVGWFRDSKAKPVTRPAHGATITTRAASAPTYGVTYPDASEYPEEIPAQTVNPLAYTIKKGQKYTVIGATKADYYYAKTIDDSIPDDHTVVHGKQKYYAIQLGHRIAFVRASDVTIG